MEKELTKEQVEKLVEKASGETVISEEYKPVKYTRHEHLGTAFVGFGYEEPALDVHFEASVTDPTFARSNSELIREFMQSGQVLASARLQQYDFPDGVDDGSTYPVSRHIDVEPEEVYQASQSTLERVRLRQEMQRIQSSKRKDKEDDLRKIKEALASFNPTDKTAAQADTQSEASGVAK